MFTITTEQLYAAMEAAGMHLDEEALNKAVDIAAQNVADEIDRQVLEELMNLPAPRREVPPADIPELWSRLRTLEPISGANSLHVHEATYLLDGLQYTAYWEFSSTVQDPFMIDIENPE